MSWNRRNYIAGGEGRDTLLEVPSELEASSVVTIDSTAGRIESATRCLKFPTATAGAKAVVVAVELAILANTKIVVASGTIGLDGSNPTTPLGILTKAIRGGAAGAARLITVNTSGQLELRDTADVVIGHPSHDLISTSGRTRFLVVYDPTVNQTATSTSAWVTMWVDGKYQWDGLVTGASGSVFDFGTTELWWGEHLEAGVDRDVDWYGDDLTLFYSDTADPATEAAHIFNMPVLRCEGEANLPPTAEGARTDWNVDEGGGTLNHTNVDDFPNDGDTTWIGTVTNTHRQTFRYSASNPLTSADTIWAVHQEMVARTTAGGKVACHTLFRDGAGNETLSAAPIAVGTSYVGVVKQNMSRPAGGSWVYTDFDLLGDGFSDLEFGGETPAAGTIAVRLTTLPGPVIIAYDETYPHAIGMV